MNSVENINFNLRNKFNSRNWRFSFRKAIKNQVFHKDNMESESTKIDWVDWNCICLVCLQSGEMKSIYDKDGNQMTFYEKIIHCSSVELPEQINGSMPEQICTNCVEDLKAAYRFRINYENSTEILKTLLQTKDSFGDSDAERKSCNSKPSKILEIEADENFREYQKLSEVYDENTEDEYCSASSSQNVTTDESKRESLKKESTTARNKLQSKNGVSSRNKVCRTENGKQGKTSKEILKQKRGRPKAVLRESSLDTELENEDVSLLVSKLTTTISYGKRSRKKDPKPLKICEICGNVYKYQHILESHMRRHRNERPYACEFCDKAFVANVELRRHMRVHTGQKPYACRHCDRKFSDFGSRLKHERTHTGERPYSCQTCGKSFMYAHVLSVHLATHTGEKKFKCEECGKGFTKKTYLLSHITSNHGSKDKQPNENGTQVSIRRCRNSEK